MRFKRGQQEIVGFVLIVVLVVVALMVFLVISANKPSVDGVNVKVSNMIDVVMRTTTECAIVYEPDYDDFEELFKSCYKGDYCSNLNVSACEYLNESFGDVVSSMFLSDASVNSWEAEFFVKDEKDILKWREGNCNGTLSGAQRSIISDGTSLVVRMRIC